VEPARIIAIALLLGSCVKPSLRSPVVEGTVGVSPSEATCPWETVERMELDRDAVRVNGVTYGVGAPGPASGFEHLLGLCELGPAIKPFRTWRATVPDPDDVRNDRIRDVLGTYALLIAVSAVSGADPVESDEVGVAPVPGPRQGAVSGVEVDAAQAFLDAMME